MGEKYKSVQRSARIHHRVQGSSGVHRRLGEWGLDSPSLLPTSLPPSLPSPPSLPPFEELDNSSNKQSLHGSYSGHTLC